MRIKNQLVALVSGVALPLVLLAAFVTYQLWQQQRQAYQQQFLERASAVVLALDTEVSVTLRTLRATGDATEILPAETDAVLRRRFRRLLENNPRWAAVTLTDAQGRVSMAEQRPDTVAPPLLDVQTVLRAIPSPTGFVSNVLATKDGRHIVYVATAITRRGREQGVIYAAISHTHWLELLRAYPVSRRGILTLMDKDSNVIARTVDDDKWVGAKAPAAFWAKTINRLDGSFEATGLDGLPYYAAFSRSKASGWVLSTGVPKSEVDEAMYWPTLIMVLAGVAAFLGALAAAWRLGGAINMSFSGLMASAIALGNRTRVPAGTLPVREAMTVLNALTEAHEQLVMREASLEASLERESAARRQAQDSSRSKDRFLAMMGHELRNPLSAISAAVEVLGAEAISQPVLLRSQDIIRRQAGHLSGMVNDLMDVAQLDSGQIVLHKHCLDLAEVAANVQLRFEETGRCAHLQMRKLHTPAWIDADEARVELLITCLLDNACKYTPRGGTVTMEVRGEAEASVLCITDTGAGITPEVAGSMFEAFTQGERTIERGQGGLGLGLALVRKLVELHGGTISASSAGPGQGASFMVTFPRVEAPMRLEKSTSIGQQEVLLTVVEDIADTREMMMLYLEATGRRINGAGDGPSGVDQILKGPSDVAVVDIGLPGFDGLEVARRVRQSPRGEGVYLVALTGYGTEVDRAKALAAGFNGFLVKPFDAERFEAVLGKVLASRKRREGE